MTATCLHATRRKADESPKTVWTCEMIDLLEAVALPNEPVTLSIEAWATKTPNSTVELHAHYLQSDLAAKHDLQLRWESDAVEDGLTRYRAEMQIPRLQAGQHFVQWNCENWSDGLCGINHTARPLHPYFAATDKRAPQSQDILLNTMHAKVFTRDAQSMAYIWPMQPWDTEFELTVPEGKSVQYYAAPKGERVDLEPGKHRLTIPKESWARIVGFDWNSLKINLHEAE